MWICLLPSLGMYGCAGIPLSPSCWLSPRFQQEDDPTDDDDEDVDQHSNLKGIENTLALMENLMELDTLTAPLGLLGDDSRSAAGFMAAESKIVSWLFTQLESDDATDTIKDRCVELLAFLSQNVDVFEGLPGPPLSVV